LQRVLKNKFIRLFSLKRNSQTFLIGYFLISFFIFDLSKAESNDSNFEKINQPKLDYLESKKELEDYILDTGDVLFIEFYSVPAELSFGEFTNTYTVSAEGEILLPRLEETYVRGLTTSELQKLLEKRYLEFLIEPEIKVRIAEFKSLRVLVRGEIRYPGLYKFPPYRSALVPDRDLTQKTIANNENEASIQSSDTSINIKRTSENITTISDVIRKAGGITSLTDLSRIEIIRDIPLGKGGGKKRAFINLNPFLNASDDSNDLRIFDGDSIFIPKLSKSSAKQIPKSVLSGLSPKFITVDIYGRVETPGNIKLPLEATLSDAIDLTGPIKPLSGKIVLIRYAADGTIVKKNISYSARAKRGSKRNPFVKQGDLISVKNSILGKTTGVISEVTAPFIGIYTTKELIENFSD
tara:strand:+ start:275 stop:1504 length:1230 start_codon:yes stop_codon:yes gene_type:complete